MTIQWHKADELPNKSMEVVVVCEGGYVANVGYSDKHKAFNTHDEATPEQAKKTALNDIIAWTERDTFIKAVGRCAK